MSNITKFQINVGGKEMSFDTEPIYQALAEKSNIGHRHPLDELEDGVLDAGEAAVKGIVFEAETSDGSSYSYYSDKTFNFPKTNAESGMVIIERDSPYIRFGTNIISFNALGDFSAITDMRRMFYSCSNLTSLDVSNFDTSNVTSMERMFYSCSNLTSLDVSNFDTSNVEDMAGMFFSCNKLLYITLGENFFKTTQTIPFDGATNLGLNEDNTDNGWLEHLATVAPQIADGQTRTIQLPNKLKNAEWASAHIATLQAKGYTIA